MVRKGDGFRLDRVDQDLAAGRLWKARDRLLGMLGTFPGSPELLGRLGEVYYRMGDWPEAGRCWFLTERDDAAAQEAIAAFQERYGLDAGRLVTRSRQKRPATPGPIGAARLRELPVPQPVPADWTERLRTTGQILLLALPWMAGLFTLLLWLATLLLPSLTWLLQAWLFGRH